MTAWIGARSLGQDAFEASLMNPWTSGAAVEKLRAAAEGVRTAASHKDLAAASADLADAMQLVGLAKWPLFLRDAADRADAAAAPAGRVDVAQALTNTVADAAPGDAPAPAPGPGYVAANPEKYIGQPPVGDGECVPFVRAATGAPRAVEWKPGDPVLGNPNLPPGTLIATFENGHYTGHAAIYMGQDASGLQVIDQWNRRENGVIIGQHPPSERTIHSGRTDGLVVDRAESYRVVK